MSKNGLFSRGRNARVKAHPAVVCTELIGQTEAFTAPRGRLEMGGLLLGHIDEDGNNVAVCGFFPEQTEESPGYCEFGGMYTAIAAAACDRANESYPGEDIPNLRIIGWIHTHPDIGIFLSGTDVNTFRTLRAQCPGRRLMAVVVDPLRAEHGVFLTEKKTRKYDPAAGMLKLGEGMEARYHALLDRLREIQRERGLRFLPCIMPGHLRGKRNAMGDRDDIEIEMRKGFFQEKAARQASVDHVNSTARELRIEISAKENRIQQLGVENGNLRRELGNLRRELNDVRGTSAKLKVTLTEIKAMLTEQQKGLLEEVAGLNQRIKELEAARLRPVLVPVINRVS
jgi:proteasome lid subunit RPN8/RPN11